MGWRAEILRIHGDERVLREVLMGSGYDLVRNDAANASSWLLIHPKYAELESANDIHKDAADVAERIREIARLENETLDLEIGAILRFKEEELKETHIIVSPASITLTLESTATITVIPNQNLPEEERARLAEEMAKREAERKQAAKLS
jgi:hypothetical protein